MATPHLCPRPCKLHIYGICPCSSSMGGKGHIGTGQTSLLLLKFLVNNFSFDDAHSQETEPVNHFILRVFRGRASQYLTLSVCPSVCPPSFSYFQLLALFPSLPSLNRLLTAEAQHTTSSPQASGRLPAPCAIHLLAASF